MGLTYFKFQILRRPLLEIELLAAGLLRNRAALSAHEALVERVACEMVRAGRITWRALSLRGQLPPLLEGGAERWGMARPDVFSIRNTSVQNDADPIVHAIKMRRSDLLRDLRCPDKRAAYLDLGGECWYVLGCDAMRKDAASPKQTSIDSLSQGRHKRTSQQPG